MRTQHPPFDTILALSPCHGGSGFAVFETRGRLVDWGLAELYSKNEKEFLVRVEAMVVRHQPTMLVLENMTGTTRGERARSLVAAAASYATTRGLTCRLVSKADVRTALGLTERATKQQIAEQVAEAYPELKAELPDRRKPWQKEARRMPMFEACVLAVTTLRSVP